MIEFAGVVYALAKDLKSYFSFTEEVKFVDNDWLEVSGFKARASSNAVIASIARSSWVRVNPRMAQAHADCSSSSSALVRSFRLRSFSFRSRWAKPHQM